MIKFFKLFFLIQCLGQISHAALLDEFFEPVKKVGLIYVVDQEHGMPPWACGLWDHLRANRIACMTSGCCCAWAPYTHIYYVIGGHRTMSDRDYNQRMKS